MTFQSDATGASEVIIDALGVSVVHRGQVAAENTVTAVFSNEDYVPELGVGVEGTRSVLEAKTADVSGWRHDDEVEPGDGNVYACATFHPDHYGVTKIVLRYLREAT